MVGLGNVGASLSFALLWEQYLDELILFDIAQDYAWAVHEDLTHATVYVDRPIKITLAKSLEEIENADLIVITAGKKRKPGMNRRDLAVVNAKVMKEIVNGLRDNNKNASYLIITNPVDAMATIVYKLLGEKSMVIGSGTSLDTARFRIAIARALKVPLAEVSGFVGGEHGEAAVMLWSTVHISGIPIDEYLDFKHTEINKEEVEKYVKGISVEIIKYQQATRWGPAGVFREIIRAFARNENRVLSVAAPFYHEDIGDTVFVSVPRVIGRSLGKDLFDELTKEEQEKIIYAAKVIYQTYRKAIGEES